MKIDVAMLQKIVNQVCEKYYSYNGQYLNTEIDYFWFIEMDQGIDFQKEPDALVASLEDDYHSLEELGRGEREISIIDLDRISNIFKAVSYEIEHQKDKFLG